MIDNKLQDTSRFATYGVEQEQEPKKEPGTPFEKVYDRALIVIEDYKLDKLAQADYEAFLLYLQGNLERSIPDFTSCNTDLSYDEFIDEDGNVFMAFDNVLSNKEINILSSIMVYNWFAKKVNDVTQFQGHLSNKEFKAHSEANNLKEKSEYMDRLREKFNQDIVDYQVDAMSSYLSPVV